MSSVQKIAENEVKGGKLSSPAELENWIISSIPLPIAAGESVFSVTFDWNKDSGVPVAFIINNYHHSEFFLKTVTLEDVPGHGKVHFVCNSWVYPAHNYKTDRIFFSNQVLQNNISMPFKEIITPSFRGEDNLLHH